MVESEMHGRHAADPETTLDLVPLCDCRSAGHYGPLPPPLPPPPPRPPPPLGFVGVVPVVVGWVSVVVVGCVVVVVLVVVVGVLVGVVEGEVVEVAVLGV